ncbi:MAG TPA: TetR/AcrR family transcriptional regulator [Kofleriaceae bacterium]|jgi:TetR/AcrR family fatty acid metabolism transcriptional regulator|nr:TetR/AcrR family transcriptional regulator [Kofleriaceae bacterium]
MTAHSAEPGKPAPPEKGDKRERILDAAEHVFAAHGFFAAKVSEIAERAGVADGTIYLYFKNKDDLLISLFESRMERVNAHLASHVAKHTKPKEKLDAFIRAYLALVKEQPAAAEVLTVELRQSAKFMKGQPTNPKFAELLRLLATIVGEGQAAGVFTDAIPAPVAARMIFGLVDEMALAWLLGDKTPESAPRGKKFDIVRAADWVGALITQGLERRSTQ